MADWIDYNTDLMRTFSKHVQDSFSYPEWAPWVLEVLQIVFGSREQVRRLHPYSFLHHARLAADHRAGLHRHLAGAARLGHPGDRAAHADDGRHRARQPAGHYAAGQLRDARRALPGAGRRAGHAVHLCADTADHGPAQRPLCRRHGARGHRCGRHRDGAPLRAAGDGLRAAAPTPSCPAPRRATRRPSTRCWARLPGPTSWWGQAVSRERWSSAMSSCSIDVEVFRMCRKAHEGITVADDRWLLDVLERRGPGGHFLSERSTRANTRNGEWYLPALGVHDSYDAWTAAGRPTVHRRGSPAGRRAARRHMSRCRSPKTWSVSSRSCARRRRRSSERRR